MPEHQVVELTGTNVRYSLSVIGIMPLVFETMSSSIASFRGKPQSRTWQMLTKTHIEGTSNIYIHIMCTNNNLPVLLYCLAALLSMVSLIVLILLAALIYSSIVIYLYYIITGVLIICKVSSPALWVIHSRAHTICILNYL